MIQVVEPYLPQPSRPSELVWRYVDTPKLLSLLLRKELYLRRVDLLPDKFEALHTKPTREELTRQLMAQPGNVSFAELTRNLVDRLTAIPKGFRRTMYVSCWRLGDSESEAMWRLYCGTHEGVALVLSYERLKESLTEPRTLIGQVKYIDFDRDVIAVGNALAPIMHKRREFEYEREVRIVNWKLLAPGTDLSAPGTPDFLSANLPTSVSLPWEPERYLERIVISPYADPWYLETVRELLARISPNLADRVVASSMGGDPPD